MSSKRVSKGWAEAGSVAARGGLTVLIGMDGVAATIAATDGRVGYAVTCLIGTGIAWVLRDRLRAA